LQAKTGSLQDIYNTTNEVHVVCLLADFEDVSFEEAMINDKLKKAMDEEIASIERNNTWELSMLATGKAKYRSTTNKVKAKLTMKKAKNLKIHEMDKHNVRIQDEE